MACLQSAAAAAQAYANHTPANTLLSFNYFNLKFSRVGMTFLT